MGGGSGRNNSMSMSSSNRYSNRRQHDRSGGDDIEEDYRGGKFNASSRGSSNRGNPRTRQSKDYNKPRGAELKDKDDHHHQSADHANSIDRGEKYDVY